MSTQYELAVKEVESVLNEKNIVGTPRTIAKYLSDLKYAEKFTGDYAEKRAFNARKNITKALESLSSRDLKSTPTGLAENELDSDQLVKRVLIHAGLVRDLADLRANYIARSAELEKRINGSMGKVPFTQQEDFRKMLVELQAVETLPLTETIHSFGGADNTEE